MDNQVKVAKKIATLLGFTEASESNYQEFSFKIGLHKIGVTGLWCINAMIPLFILLIKMVNKDPDKFVIEEEGWKFDPVTGQPLV